MSQSQSPASAHNVSNIVCLLRNFRLLDLDKDERFPQHEYNAFEHDLRSLDSKKQAEIFDWAFFKLFQLWDPKECQKILHPFFPPLEAKQASAFKDGLFKLLTQLRTDGALRKDVFFRKSQLQNYDSNKIVDLLIEVSSAVLRKRLKDDSCGRRSIAERLILSQHADAHSYNTLRPLSIAYRTSLQNILTHKEAMRARYGSFSKAMTLKEEALKHEFEDIMRNQEIIDASNPSDGSVSRMVDTMERHWHDERTFKEVAQLGEDVQCRDLFLDADFDRLWLNYTSGHSAVDQGIEVNGLLKELEQRVDAQKTRLDNWTQMKKNLQERSQHNRPARPSIAYTKSPFPKARQDLRAMDREKEIVFSPRRSPRKSVMPDDSTSYPLRVPINLQENYRPFK